MNYLIKKKVRFSLLLIISFILLTGCVTTGKDFKRSAGAGVDSFQSGSIAFSKHNYAKALRFWQPLVERGDTRALNAVGLMYQNGQGVEKNLDKAHKLYQQAAAAGDAQALNNLGVMYEGGYGVLRDYDVAANYYQRAANLGYKPAQFNLGRIHQSGAGVTANFNEAVRWYQTASGPTK